MKFGVILRSSGERTEQLSYDSAKEGGPVDMIHITPFAEAVRQMIIIAMDKQYDYFMGLDADVILMGGWEEKILSAIKAAGHFFRIDFWLIDRFQPTPIKGVHLYNAQYCRRMLEAIEAVRTRPKPESGIGHHLGKKDLSPPFALGYHGFEQYKADIFNRLAFKVAKDPYARARFNSIFLSHNWEEKIARAGFDFGLKDPKRCLSLNNAKNKIPLDEMVRFRDLDFTELRPLEMTLTEFRVQYHWTKL